MRLLEAKEKEKLVRLNEYQSQNLISAQSYQQAVTDIVRSGEAEREAIKADSIMRLAEMEDAVSKLTDGTESRLEQIRQIEESKLEILSAYRKKGLVTEEQYQKKVSDIEKKYSFERVKASGDAFGTIAENMRTALGEASSTYKAFAITQATIATYTSAVEAYKSAAAIPYVGFILGPVAAAAAIGAGLANVAAIRSAREQGGIMTSGSPYQMAERGKAEVIVPAGASRARTAQQMRDIMGQNGGGNQIKGVTIVNNTTGRVDSATTEIDQEGMLRVLIDEHVSNSLLTQDSQISKARRASAGQPGF